MNTWYWLAHHHQLTKSIGRHIVFLGLWSCTGLSQVVFAHHEFWCDLPVVALHDAGRPVKKAEQPVAAVPRQQGVKQAADHIVAACGQSVLLCS